MSAHILPVPHFEQSDEGYCLPACARMVLAYLGIERTEAEISQLLGTTEFGTPARAIQRLSLWGIEVNYGPRSLPKLRSALADRQPVIIFVQTQFLDYWDQNQNVPQGEAKRTGSCDCRGGHLRDATILGT
jgi:ABC-type bacteriocin/lantibiotic exporter with double-glycine peptidase domain